MLLANLPIQLMCFIWKGHERIQLRLVKVKVTVTLLIIAQLIIIMNKIFKKGTFCFASLPSNPNTTNTLSILTRNKLQLQAIVSSPKPSFQTKLHLPSYLHMSQ